MLAALGPLLGLILNIVADIFKVKKETRENWAKTIEYSQKKRSDSVRLRLAAKEQKLKKQEEISKYRAEKLRDESPKG